MKSAFLVPSLQMQNFLKDVYKLACEHGMSELQPWLAQELYGYSANSELPDYRLLDCQLFGLFTYPQQRQRHLEEIHHSCLGERERCQLRHIHLRQALSHHLNLKPVRQAWPDALLHAYAKEIIPGFVCIKAWQSYEQALAPRLLQGFCGHLWHLAQQDPHFLSLLTSYIETQSPNAWFFSQWQAQENVC